MGPINDSRCGMEQFEKLGKLLNAWEFVIAQASGHVRTVIEKIHEYFTLAE